MDVFLYHQFAEIERDHWWFRARRKIVADVLRSRLQPGRERHILDIGCGTGGMLETLMEFGLVCGMDASPEALNYCRAKWDRQAELRLGKIPDDLSTTITYDVVTSFDVIEHIDDDVGALESIRRVIVPGGLFICTVPAFEFLWGAHDNLNHHRRRYTHSMLRRHLEAANFKVERMTYFNTWLFPLIAGVRLAHRALGNASRTSRSDFVMPPHWANWILTQVFASEALLLRHTSLPIGVSLLALCERPR